jgi:hypothetical protein
MLAYLGCGQAYATSMPDAAENTVRDVCWGHFEDAGLRTVRTAILLLIVASEWSMLGHAEESGIDVFHEFRCRGSSIMELLILLR